MSIAILPANMRYIRLFTDESKVTEATASPASSRIYCTPPTVYRTGFNVAAHWTPRSPAPFEYTVRFEPLEVRMGHHRTVLVTRLPDAVNTTTLLEKVTGGMIVSAKILDTRPITGFLTGMVEFLHASSAARFVEHTLLNPLIYADQVAPATVLETPTWPLSIRLRQAIYNHGHTRCLAVTHLAGTPCFDAIRRTLGAGKVTTLDPLEHLGFVGDALHIRFNSIDDAGRAFEMLRPRTRRGTTRIEFVPDPCDARLEQLTMVIDGV
ncbi:MAG: hypothetical protein M1833_002792 [Piccolia ochrophora]|nr:MAG: hypothetical protein M1833_002792 [Piccolia ochrophora]